MSNDVENLATKLLDRANQAEISNDKFKDHVLDLQKSHGELNGRVIGVEKDNETFNKLWESEKKHFEKEMDTLTDGIKMIRSTLWKAALSLIGALALAFWTYHTFNLERDKEFHNEIIKVIKDLSNK